jgi:hypothetical protein
MKTRFFIPILLLFLLNSLTPVAITSAQEGGSKQVKKTKAEKVAEQSLTFDRIYNLVNSRQFVFKAEFNQGSDLIFVVVDSGFAAVQNGNRNNLEGKVTRFEVKKNEKQKNLSVTIMMRGAISTADIFLFIGPGGDGTATVKSDFPGYFSFDGKVVDFENANIDQGGSHFLH